MPRVTAPGFLGPTNELQAYTAESERTINLYLERIAPGVSKTDRWLRNTPGLRPFVVLPTAPVRGLFEQDGRAFAVGGGVFYELHGSSASACGSVASDSYLASIASNGTAGHQILVVSGGHGYIFDLNSGSFGAISDPDFPTNVRMGEFIDGYFIVSVADSRSWQISALEDGTSWDALDVAERSIASDNIVSMIRRSRELWFLGTHTSEVWYDAGDPLFPFAPTGNTLIEHGSAAPFSVQRVANTLIWCDQNVLGQGLVVIANGYTPERISTYAIDRFVRAAGVTAAGDLTTTVGWSYQEHGHEFYCLMVPQAQTTLCTDLTLPDMWHERARGTCDSALIPSVVNTHMFAFGKHLVGDRFSGAIYDQSHDYADEQIVG